MNVSLTLIALAVFAVIVVLIRTFWDSLPKWIKRLLLFFCVLSVITLPLASAVRINTTIDLLNNLSYWCFIISYIFFVVLFTLFRPVWLTSLVAVILVIPVLSASVILPLTLIFIQQSHTMQPIGDGLVSDRMPVGSVTNYGSGVSLAIYRRFLWLPLLQRREQGAYYLNSQCDATAAFAVLQPDHYRLRMVCPAPSDAPMKKRDLIVTLYSH